VLLYFKPRCEVLLDAEGSAQRNRVLVLEQNTFAFCREVPHLLSPFRSGQGGLNTALMKGLTAQAASYHQLVPASNCLTATADARGSARPTVVSELPPGS
jgi:hypothetical protein